MEPFGAIGWRLCFRRINYGLELMTESGVGARKHIGHYDITIRQPGVWESTIPLNALACLIVSHCQHYS
jgi:hypothetical protein